MRKLLSASKWPSLVIISILFIFLSGCRIPPAPPPVEYTLPELKYRLISNFGGVFWCDPDFYPVARQGQEQANAIEQFPTIKTNTAEFSAILNHLNLPDKAAYTDEEKLEIYREHKKLTYAVQVTPSGDAYSFTLRVGEGQGERIDGTITRTGNIKVLKKETSFNTCPICLAGGTLIDTPGGPIAVELLRAGMTVWTSDASGNRIPAAVAVTAQTPVPAFFKVLRVTLSDGRTVTASPGHPTYEGRPLGEYQAGEFLDGAFIVALEPRACDGGVTYDFLPSGETGLYWANGILLKSTMVKR